MAAAVALDFFTTGLWVGHVAFWILAPVIGAAVGAWLEARRPARGTPNLAAG